MSWPLSHEFNEAIQTPAEVFADADLRGGDTVVGATGLPLPRSGNFADVYQVVGADGRNWAVKCFTRPVAGLAERYARVGAALAKAGLPFTVGFDFLAEGIKVGGAWRPVVKMEWVEGLLLNQVVRDNAAKPAVLAALGQVWGRLCKRLRDAGVAHADVQYGNVLLVPGARAGAFGLKLIDYDGMWVPALANTPSGEAGHPSFQHPARAATRAYSPDLDRFPHLAVATALRGLAVGGSPLWEKYDNGDNLLFTEDDFKNPAASAVMADLWKTDAPAVQALVGRLAVACGRPIPQTPWLDQIAPEGEPLPLDDAARREAATALGVALPVAVAVPVPVAMPVAEPEANPFAIDDSAPPEPRRPRSEKRQPAVPNRMPLYIGAGVLALVVLVGGVVGAAVLLSGGKPAETVQKEEPEPPPPEPRGTPKPKPRGPDPVTPKPNDPDPMPMVPVTHPEPAAEPVPLKLRYQVATQRAIDGLPTFDADGKSFALARHLSPWDVTIFDALTGQEVRRVPTLGSKTHRLFSLAGGRIGCQDEVNPQVFEWEVATGNAVTRLFPQPPGPKGAATVSVSPNGRFLAVGVPDPGPGTELPESPLKVYDSTTGRPVVAIAWRLGQALFTADSARVLTVDDTGKFRWFRLTDGQPDGGWDFKLASNGSNARFAAMSADGGVVLYTGPAPGKGRTTHVLDGKTGAVLHSFPEKTYVDHRGWVSDDGRRVALVRNDGEGLGRVFEVLDPRGTLLATAPIPQAQLQGVYGVSWKGKTVVIGQREGGGPRLFVYDLPDAPGAVAVKPPDAPVTPKNPPAVPAVQGRRWSMPTEQMFVHLHVSDGAKVVYAGARGPGGMAALDLATGNPRPEFADFAGAATQYVAPFGEGKVAAWRFVSRTVRVWDEKTGRELAPVEIPDVPPPANVQGIRPFLAVAPDGKSAAFGYDRGGQDREKNLPLALFDLAGSRRVGELTWAGGNVRFTADGKRVLVADYTGKCRWFKTPGGEPDGEFDLDPSRFWKHELHGVSADGAVLAYFGPLGRTGGIGPVSLDGRTGAVLKLFPSAPNNNCVVSVSADGRRIAWTLNNDGASSAVVADPRTGAELARFPVGGPIAHPALSADGTVLVVAAGPIGNVINAYDVPGGAVAVRPPDVPIVPKQPPPPPPDFPELKARWGPVEVKAKLDAPAPFFDDDGKRVVLIGSGAIAAVTFDARTGAAGRELSNPALKGRFHRLFPLDGGKFAFQTETDRELLLWDPALGLPRPRAFTPSARPGVPVMSVSPNGRYLTVGAARGGPAEPLQVTDTTLNKTVPVPWAGGTTAFTADSSRLLVADDAGKVRWHRLPGCAPDGDGWALGAGPGVAPRLVALSADGGVVLFHGRPAGKELTLHLLDGKTGVVTHSFPANRYAAAGGVVAADGKRVGLVRDDGSGAPLAVEVFDAAGAPVVARRLPTSTTAAAVSLEARAVAAYDRSARLTVLDLPAAP